jgi:hypothetical protein
MLTSCLANSGRMRRDHAFGRYTFQVPRSALKPGCSQSRIVIGVDNMIDKFNCPSMRELVIAGERNNGEFVL